MLLNQSKLGHPTAEFSDQTCSLPDGGQGEPGRTDAGGGRRRGEAQRGLPLGIGRGRHHPLVHVGEEAAGGRGRYMKKKLIYRIFVCNLCKFTNKLI